MPGKDQMKQLLVVAMLIIIGLVTHTEDPQHINKQVVRKSEVKAQTTSPTKPQVVHEQTVTPVITSSKPDCNKYDALIIENFGAEQLNTAKAVMRAESGCRTDAVGDNHITFTRNGQLMGMSCGLFQIRILPGRNTCEAYKNPIYAIQQAGSMLKKSGWQPWSAWKSGKYKQFL